MVTSMFKLYDMVKLKKADSLVGVSETDTGVIVDILNGGAAYTVEFIDSHGNTIENALYKEYVSEELLLIGRC